MPPTMLSPGPNQPGPTFSSACAQRCWTGAMRTSEYIQQQAKFAEFHTSSPSPPSIIDRWIKLAQLYAIIFGGEAPVEATLLQGRISLRISRSVQTSNHR